MSKRKSWKDTNVKNTRIDRATGQNKRVKVTVKPSVGLRPQRSNGHIVPKGRLAFLRAKRAR